MSYRIYVNKSQWLGNNEFPEEIITELKRQGAEFDEDGIFKFQLKDLEGLLEACELYVENLIKKDPRVANFSDSIVGENKWPNLKYGGCDRLTFYLQNILECAYIFVPANLLKYIGEENYEYDKYDRSKKYFTLKLKKDAEVIIEGF